MEMEIQSLLEKLLDVNDAMSRCAASAAPTTSVTQKLARHRDILHEFTQVFILFCHAVSGNFSSIVLTSTQVNYQLKFTWFGGRDCFFMVTCNCC